MAVSSGASISSNESNKNQKSKRTSITVLVLGDEGVGKTSLISTFVSRYFPEAVPGLMTRVRLPQDPDTSSVTTIIDSQNGDTALEARLMNSTGSISVSVSQSSNKTTSTSSSISTKNTTTTNTFPSLMMDNVDSIILVYDLDRPETFTNVENHWLPLIERCYQGEIPVIVAGNKMDKLRPSNVRPTPLGSTSSDESKGDEKQVSTGTASNNTTTGGGSAASNLSSSQQSSSRQQIVSVMSRYRFIRQWIKCSAKSMTRVDDIFLKSQQAILYPVAPLYDLDTGSMTVSCKKAFTRIFRMYDMDFDGLLSDYEIFTFQNDTFVASSSAGGRHSSIALQQRPFDNKDLHAWKKLISRRYPNDNVLASPSTTTTARTAAASTNYASAARSPAARASATATTSASGNTDEFNRYFTETGFLAIFDIFINQNRLEHCWHVLRKFGYTDDLQLTLPSFATKNDDEDYGINMRGNKNSPPSWKLSRSSRMFLTNLFYQFDSDKDGLLSIQDMLKIFAILPDPALPPWHPKRSRGIFKHTFSTPRRHYYDLNARIRPPSSASSAASPPQSPRLASPPLSPHPTQQQQNQRQNRDGHDDIDNHATPESPSLSASGITILSEESLPTIGTTASSYANLTRGTVVSTVTNNTAAAAQQQFFLNNNKSKMISYLDWMGYWHTLAAISPTVIQQELFRLGHIEGANTASPVKSYITSGKAKQRGNGRSSSRRYRNQRKIASMNDTNIYPANPPGNTRQHQQQIKSQREIKVLVLGSEGSGKTSFLNYMCNNLDSNNEYEILDTSTNQQPGLGSPTSPETCGTYVQIKKKKKKKKKRASRSKYDTAGTYKKQKVSSASPPPAPSCVADASANSDVVDEDMLVVYLIFTELPCSHSVLGSTSTNEKHNKDSGNAAAYFKDSMIQENDYNLVLLLFDTTDNNSFEFVRKLEDELLTDDNIPRIFVGTKMDKVTTQSTKSRSASDSPAEPERVISAAAIPTATEQANVTSAAIENARVHCRQLDIEPPLLLSSYNIITAATVTATAEEEETQQDVGKGIVHDSTSRTSCTETTTASQIKKDEKLPVTEQKEEEEEILRGSGNGINSSNTSGDNKTYNDDTSNSTSHQRRLIILDHIARSSNALLKELEYCKKSRPHEDQKRRDAAWKRKMIFLGGIVGIGVVVVVGVNLLWGSGSSSSSSTSNSSSSAAGGSSSKTTTAGSPSGAAGGSKERFGWIGRMLFGR